MFASKITLSILLPDNKIFDFSVVRHLKEVMVDIKTGTVTLFPVSSVSTLYDYLPFHLIDNFNVIKSIDAIILKRKL